MQNNQTVKVIYHQQHPIWMTANQRIRRMEMQMVQSLLDIANVAENVNAVRIQMILIPNCLVNCMNALFILVLFFFIDEVTTVLKNQNEILSLLTGL